MMSTMGVKKTLNLHKYSVRVNDIILDWKIILPVIFSVSGLIIGCMYSKGEGALYQKVTSYFSEIIINQSVTQLIPYILKSLLIPSVFTGLLFFFGMSAYGGFIAGAFPMIFSYFIGIISYYMYLNYTLKGLAYCVIIIFPYAVFSLISIILCTAESINMSELILRSISKSKKYTDYSFKVYYKTYIRNYAYILLAAVIKLMMEYLFGGLFTF